jgi:hypothetical protein
VSLLNPALLRRLRGGSTHHHHRATRSGGRLAARPGALVVAVAVSALTLLGGTAVAQAAPSGGIDPAGWQSAFNTHNHQTVLSWFSTNVTGPRTATSGTHPGGTISSQAAADRVAGKRVTGDMTISCTCLVHDFTTNSRINVTGNVKLQYFKQDGLKQTKRTDLFVVGSGATADLLAGRIVNSQDGIRTGGHLTATYTYISNPSTSNPLDHHQDGIQQYGGTLSVSRSAINYTGSNTSTILIKPDSSTITASKWANNLLMGGGYSIHMHDDQPGNARTIQASGFAFPDNLVARGYTDGLASVWHVNSATVSKAGTYKLFVSTAHGGGTRALRDGARI